MNETFDPSKPMPRGASPSSPEAKTAAPDFLHLALNAAPAAFLMWPTAMSAWGNYQYGDCVTAEEAFAKACFRSPIFVPPPTVVAWASSMGFLRGSSLTEVMSVMQNQGFVLNGKQYNTGPYHAVDWKSEANLHSAIFNSGPVKIGVASSDFETNSHGSVSPGKSGWTMYNLPANQRLDHCASICGYGKLSDLVSLFKDRGVTVQITHGMPTDLCYAVFTWNSIGIIDRQSLLNVTYEAWARKPVTNIKTVSTLYLTTQGADGVWALDVLQKSKPTQFASTKGRGFKDLVPIGQTLFMTAQGADGIWTFDTASQAAPVQIASTAGHAFNGSTRNDVNLFLTTQDSGGIWRYQTAQYLLPVVLKNIAPVQIPTTTNLGFEAL